MPARSSLHDFGPALVITQITLTRRDSHSIVRGHEDDDNNYGRLYSSIQAFIPLMQSKSIHPSILSKKP